MNNRKGEVEWKIRIGIHTGTVVGGVVGISKYTFQTPITESCCIKN